MGYWVIATTLILIALAGWALIHVGTRTEEAQELQIGARLAARHTTHGGWGGHRGMRLPKPEATFVGYYDAKHGSFRRMPTMDGAQGLLFVCPLCGNHSVLCWFRNPTNAPAVPDDAFPKPGRWEVEGTDMGDVGLAPFVNLDTQNAREGHACPWHGWVKNGDAS